MSLPTDNESRKAFPIFRGPLMYFPDALLEIAAVCKAGNDQHNPGEPLHWARGKSMEQMDTAVRHMMDHGLGTTKDIDGRYHMAKAAWRCLAELQLTIERERVNGANGSDMVGQAASIDEAGANARAYLEGKREPKVGDRVRITHGGKYTGRVGTLKRDRAVGQQWRVKLDDGPAVRHGTVDVEGVKVLGGDL